VATFGRDKDLPWVAYASPVLPAGPRLERVLALDAAGKLVGGEEQPYGREPLCRPARRLGSTLPVVAGPKGGGGGW
jgi:hypothetical protein